MGAGPRFQLGVHLGLLFGVTFNTFPYALCVNINFLCFWFFIGLGKPYDE